MSVDAIGIDSDSAANIRRFDITCPSAVAATGPLEVSVQADVDIANVSEDEAVVGINGPEAMPPATSDAATTITQKTITDEEEVEITTTKRNEVDHFMWSTELVHDD